MSQDNIITEIEVELCCHNFSQSFLSTSAPGIWPRVRTERFTTSLDLIRHNVMFGTPRPPAVPPPLYRYTDILEAIQAANHAGSDFQPG
jgi:hypothetical protein